MSNLKVGDQVICMPNGDRGYIKELDEKKNLYPIVVYYTEYPNRYEGAYTLEGFSFLTDSPYHRRHYITKDITKHMPPVTIATSISQPTTKTSPYWSIAEANSLFIRLAHTDQGGRIIPINRITSIYDNNVSVVLSTSSINYDLGPIQFDEVANLLFTQQQSNSI